MRGIGGRDRRGSRERQSERVDRRRHRRGRAHGHARAEGTSDPVFHLAPRAFVDRSGAAFGPVLPDVGSRSQRLPPPVAAEHRPGRHEDEREVRARRAHDHRRHGLVATTEQDGAIGRVRAQRLLGLHRQQVAVEHGRRLHEGLAEGQQRDLHREAASLPDAALDVFSAQPEVRVTRVGVAPGVEDRDDGFPGHVVGRVTLLSGARPMAGRTQVVFAEPAVAAQLCRSLPGTVHASRSRNPRATGASSASCAAVNGETYGGMGPAGAMPASSVA